MLSLRDAVQAALFRRIVPAYQTGSTRDLALKIGLSPPVSVRDVIAALGELPPAHVTYDSGPLTAGYVHGSARVFLQSDGLVSLIGEASEEGVFGDNFILAIALLDVKDPSGKTAVFGYSDTLAGQGDIGFSNKNRIINGFSQVVMDNWDAVKSTRVSSILQVRTDPWQVTETIVVGLFVAIGIAIGAAVLFSGSSEDPNVQCGVRPIGPDRNPTLQPGDPTNPGIGAEGYCRKEWN